MGTDTTGRSGVHLTGEDSGWPVGGEAEPSPHKDGSGADDLPHALAASGDEITYGARTGPHGTPVLDDFDRPDEAPPAGWVTPSGVSHGCAIRDRQLVRDDTANAFGGGSQFDQPFDAPQEAWFTLAATFDAATFYLAGAIYLDLLSPAGEYDPAFEIAVGGPEDGSSTAWTVPIGPSYDPPDSTPALAAGDGIGVSWDGDALTLWRREGLAGAWISVLELDDASTDRVAGYLSLLTTVPPDSTNGVSEFGGGSF